MEYCSPSLDIWLWQAQALGPREVIMLNPDGLESMRPLALMPQPATHDVMSQQQVWATRPVHRVSLLVNGCRPVLMGPALNQGLDTSLQIYRSTRKFSVQFMHAWLAVETGAAPLDRRSLLDLA